MGNYYPPITCFTDALAEAWAMFERFGFAQAAVLLDDDGNVLQAIAFTHRRRHTHDTALDWAMHTVQQDRHVSRLLLISAGVDPQELREDDITTFRDARAAFALEDVQVLDWIQVDRENARSLACATGTPTWVARPESEDNGIYLN